jgi:uncharacterized protein
MPDIDFLRRRFLQWSGIAGGLFAAGAVRAADNEESDSDLWGEAAHHIVYQCNKAEEEYLDHVLFSVGELVRRYAEEVEIVVACFGPGIQLLGRTPERPIPKLLRQRASSLAQYGVKFHACGNTMKSLNWDEKDIVAYAKIVPIGVQDIMLLQEKGFGYISI